MFNSSKPNYSAWHIDAKEFSDSWTEADKLAFFARYAILAPSGHNTQPWKFVTDRQTLLLKIRPGRELPHSGKLAAEPYISLGCCLETLERAAEGFGYRLSIDCPLTSGIVSSVKITGRCTPLPEILSAITERTSNRSSYERTPPDEKWLNGVTSSVLPGASLHAITRSEDISFMSEKTHTATLALMGEPDFREELSHWVRNNLTKQHDGMPGFVQGMPTPPSLIAKHIIRRIDISKTQSKVDAQRIIDSGALVLILNHNNDPSAHLNAGRLYARVCIKAQQHGLASSGIAAAVLDRATRQQIVQRLGLHNQPLALIRLGKASRPARHTPRWPIETALSQTDR